MKHKWHKEIKAWADGAEIESKWNNEKEWQLVDNTPQWFTDEGFEYRIKPQPKEPQYLYVYSLHNSAECGFLLKHQEIPNYAKVVGKIKLEQDDE